MSYNIVHLLAAAAAPFAGFAAQRVHRSTRCRLMRTTPPTRLSPTSADYA